ncbi:hypothetical protein GGR95_000891 [Sulfitobacter undariae]|uniref:Uncharacterized protein n=1 Tax=Sulfitobacter undariae TaxID=1563671 RepID=A0A7W6E210_9RHOB|nr:hypothetical protein [Sulfitobacter undariae]
MDADVLSQQEADKKYLRVLRGRELAQPAPKTRAETATASAPAGVIP